MSIPTSVLAQMATLGLTAEQAVAVASMLSTVEVATRDSLAAERDEVLDARRASDRSRTALRRSRMDVTEAEWHGLRGLVFDRDGKICTYCGDQDGPFEIDHIQPISRGGTSHPHNLCVACRPCNASKGARSFEEWRTGQ